MIGHLVMPRQLLLAARLAIVRRFVLLWKFGRGSPTPPVKPAVSRSAADDGAGLAGQPSRSTKKIPYVVEDDHG